MSYLKIIEWELVPCNLPVITKNCPKCGKKTVFINTEKFRVNANKSHIDIWLIYQCSKCKSTLNMTIYERIHPNDISREEYHLFLANDKELAKKYGFDVRIHNKNMLEMNFDQIEFQTIKKETNEYCEEENIQQIKIICNYPIQIRADKLLCETLGLSRSKIKSLCDRGIIYSNQEKNWLNKKVKDGMIIFMNGFSEALT